MNAQDNIEVYAIIFLEVKYMDVFKRVILVTGLSGAGKTTAMGVLEDIGYNCIDRYPKELIHQFIEMFETSVDPLYQNVALSVTALDYQLFLDRFSKIECEVQTLYIEADLDVLLLRYKYNRRTHPLLVMNRANSLEEAIAIESEEFEAVRSEHVVHIDTTHLSNQDLRKKMIQLFSFKVKPNFSVSFVSFGYRYGLPLDADLVFDVRFLANPYWVEALRAKSGNDREVFDFVMDHKKTQAYMERLLPFLDYSLKEYQKEGKSHFTIGIGCTGGQHRSVSLVNWLFDHYQKQFNCFKDHRDVGDGE